MPIENFEQIRAQHALDFKRKIKEKKVVATGKEGGDAIRKIPAMIMTNGLLAAIAFAIEEKKNKNTHEMEPRSKGHRAIFDEIALHLASQEIGIVSNVKDASSLIDCLARGDSQTLKLATDEALAWLGYAKRFVSGGDDEATDIEEID